MDSILFLEVRGVSARRTALNSVAFVMVAGLVLALLASQISIGLGPG